MDFAAMTDEAGADVRKRFDAAMRRATARRNKSNFINW